MHTVPAVDLSTLLCSRVNLMLDEPHLPSRRWTEAYTARAIQLENRREAVILDSFLPKIVVHTSKQRIEKLMMI